MRNEFFCDKYDLVTAEKLNLRVAGEVHRSRNLLTGKEVCVWMLPVEDIPQTPTSGKNQVLQNNLASSEGLLSVFESFHDGHKYIIVTETFQQTLRDYIQSGTGVRDEIGLLDFALQLFSGAVTLAKIEALYLSWSVDEIFMVRSLQGTARPKFGVYGSPYDQMNKPKSGVQKTNLTAGEMNIWMGKLLFFMAYGQEHTGQPQTGKPRIPLSAGTSEMITNLLGGKFGNSVQRLSAFLETAHRNSIPLTQDNTVSSGFTGKKRVVTASGNVYDGYWKDGFREGSGTYTWKAGHSYTGEWSAGKTHGKGRYEFADGTVYEGMFSKGKFSGFGFYSFPNRDVYEGEFLNDRFHGQGSLKFSTGYVLMGTFFQDSLHGKGTFARGKFVIYEGDWQHGFYDGQGVKNYQNGDKFVGNWKNGYKEGNGVYTHQDGTCYRGSYHKGKKHCEKGLLTYSSGIVYEGPFAEGFKSGKGTLVFPDGKIYVGEFKEDQFDGKGILYFPDDPAKPPITIQGVNAATFSAAHTSALDSRMQPGDNFRSNMNSVRRNKYLRYEGDWKKGCREGQGKLAYLNNDVYQGEFFQDKRNGVGTFRSAGGGYYEGSWKEGLAHGTGNMYYANGEVYIGNWQMGMKHGRGTLRSQNGECYEGDFANDEFDGQGQLTYLGGAYYRGQCKNGLMHGKGRMQFNTTAFYEGDWKHDKFDGIGILKDEKGITYEGNWVEGMRNGLIKTTYADGRIEQSNYQKDLKEGQSAHVNRDGVITLSKYHSGLRVKNSEKQISEAEFRSLRQ